MPLSTLIFVVIIIGLVAAFVTLSQKEKSVSGSWIQFFAKGKEAGFSLKEIELLRRLAIRCNIEEPTALFWSQNQLDICIRSMVRGMRMSGEGDEQGNQDFLSRLYDFRKKVEMEKPKIKTGISTSRQISEGQTLRVLVAETGVFRSQVVKNTTSYMTISRPVNPKITNMNWNGQKLSVYFWREDDAGYVFDSLVEDEVFSKGISSLKISHNDALFRTQKRKSIRIKMHKAAFLYLIKDGEPPGKLEMNPGLKCFLEDLSDGGCAVIVGGNAEAGLRVKVQFALDNSPISMSGTVRSVDFNEGIKRSILHIEADQLSLETRNKILGEVFGMLPEEDEDELPFRLLDDEVMGMADSPQTNQETGNDGA
ncbi:MAG TPA: pilus assembly protein PilZ [Treponema sp.]|nr:pilus assembly protein PilZ [Treponema sp.]